jgi:anti-sigma regulatory factor (Ser/Thr protein kinase)
MTASPAILQRIRLDPEAVSAALGVVRDFALRAGLANWDVLAIIVEELVCNLVDYGGQPGEEIELALSSHEEGVRLRLSDGCAPFDPRVETRADLPPDRGGGAGLAMVRAWSTVEAYERIGARNTLRLLIGPERLR